MKIKELMSKKQLIITGVISVILTFLNIILIREVENGIDIVKNIWEIIILLSLISTLILSVVKRTVRTLFQGIIYITLCISISYIIMVARFLFFL